MTGHTAWPFGDWRRREGAIGLLDPRRAKAEPQCWPVPSRGRWTGRPGFRTHFATPDTIGEEPDMACRGVHFALTPDEMGRLIAAGDDEALMAVIDEIEDRWDRDWLV